MPVCAREIDDRGSNPDNPDYHNILNIVSWAAQLISS